MNNYNKLMYPFFFAILVGCKDTKSISETEISKKNENPNIVLIYVDDLGYGDLGVYGQEIIQTPHIDKLASEGMLFTQHYAGSTVCAPSRAALLTGKHTGHTSVRGNSPEGQLLEDNEITISELLRTKGYKTGTIGKWGIGNHPLPSDPKRNGFDHAYGYVNMWHAHNFYPEFLYRNGVKESLKGNATDMSYDYPNDMKEGTGVAKKKETYVLDKFQEEALSFIESNQDDSFFLYYCINLPHANNEAGYFTGDGMEVPSYGEYAEKEWPNPEKGFAQMMTLIDDTVGEIQEKLKSLDLEQDTMIIFVSDNGPHNEGGHDAEFFNSNGAYRGYKRDLYEGGIRVPLIIKWPGNVKAGSIAENPVATWDFLPTFADMVKGDVPDNIDGVSFLPTLLGDKENQKEHDYLYWEFYELGGRQALRVGDWKYIKLNVSDASLPLVKELYNLKQDPFESDNIISKNLEKAMELDSLMQKAHVEHELLSLFPNSTNAETRF